MRGSQPRIGETVHSQDSRCHASASNLPIAMDAVAGLLDGPRAHDAFLLRSTLDPPWSLRIRGRGAAGGRGGGARGSGGRARRRGAGAAARPATWRSSAGPTPTPSPTTRPRAPQIVIEPGQRCTTPDGVEVPPMTDLGVRTWGNAPDGATVMLTGTYQIDGEVAAGCSRAAARSSSSTRPRGTPRSSPCWPTRSSRTSPARRWCSTGCSTYCWSPCCAPVRAAGAEVPAWYRADGDPVVGPALRLIQNHPRGRGPWPRSRAGTRRVPRRAGPALHTSSSASRP